MVYRDVVEMGGKEREWFIQRLLRQIEKEAKSYKV